MSLHLLSLPGSAPFLDGLTDTGKAGGTGRYLKESGNKMRIDHMTIIRIEYAILMSYSRIMYWLFGLTPASWLIHLDRTKVRRRFVDFLMGEGVLFAYRIDFDEWREIK